MTNDKPDREPEAHLVIAGTGRAGTSFLVRYLTELGLDTHLGRRGERDSWDESANAGLETVPLPNQAWDLPYVVKYPWLYQCIDHILGSGIMRLDAVIIPVRDLGEAAISRTLVELQSMHRSLPWMAELDQSWEVWGSTPGGLTYSLNPLDQGRLLAVGFHHLVERLIRADIPIALVAFPLLIEDPHYLFRKLRPLLPETVSEDTAVAAHRRVSDLAKVRVGRELDMATRSDSPSHGQVTRYVSHDRLDAIAVRRELARVHNLVADLKVTALRAEEEATSAQMMAEGVKRLAAAADAEAISARDEAANARVETAHLREQVTAAQEEADRSREQAARLHEQVIAAQEETDRSREQAARLHEQVIAAQEEVDMLREDSARLHEQISVSQIDVARLRHDLQLVYASRSWRLTSGYRIIGRAIARIRAGIRHS